MNEPAAPRMINIEKVLARIPCRKSFPSLASITGFTEALRKDPRFQVEIAGRSTLGKPVYHVRFGTGRLRVLFVGFPHPNEPIGGGTVVALLTLLKNGCPELAGQDVEWHVIPCITPDGTSLTEGWTGRPFSFQRLMKYFYRPEPRRDVETTLPFNYKRLDFKKPVSETLALMKVLASARPDLYYSLHNAVHGEAHYRIGRDIGAGYYAQLYRLLHSQGLKHYRGKFSWGKEYGKGVYSEVSIQAEYDLLEKQKRNPVKYLKCGATPVEYLRKYNARAFSFVSELPLIAPRSAAPGKNSCRSRRSLHLRAIADNRFIGAVILNEWRDVKNAVNKKSLFYPQVNALLAIRAEHLRAFSFESKLLTAPAYNGQARRMEELEAGLQLHESLCYYWQLVRLLEDSRQTPRIKAAGARIKALLEEFCGGLEEDFSEFKPIPVGRLVKAQLGSGLVVINSMLAAGH